MVTDVAVGEGVEITGGIIPALRLSSYNCGIIMISYDNVYMVVAHIYVQVSEPNFFI